MIGRDKPQGTTAGHYVRDIPDFQDVILRCLLRGATTPFPALAFDMESMRNVKGQDLSAWISDLSAKEGT